MYTQRTVIKETTYTASAAWECDNPCTAASYYEDDPHSLEISLDNHTEHPPEDDIELMLDMTLAW